MTAKHMYVCVSQNTRDSSSWKLSKLSSCESTNVFEKERKIVSLSSSKPRKEKGKKAFSVEAAADLASNDQGSFYNQSLQSHWLPAFSISSVSLVTWTEFREEDVSLNV